MELCKLAEESKMSLVDIQESIRAMQQMKVAHCRLKDPALCYEIRHVPENKRALAQKISSRLCAISKEGKHRLDFLYKIATSASRAACEEEMDSAVKSGVERYFDAQQGEESHGGEDEGEEGEGGEGKGEGEGEDGGSGASVSVQNTKFLSRDVRVFISGNKHLLQRQKQLKAPLLTGRAIARIMQGVSSPAYPAATWGRNTMWGQYIDADFEVLHKAANREMIWYLTNRANQAAATSKAAAAPAKTDTDTAKKAT